ncbi:hypothetical protein RI129_011345 [Pyrocoelia pectoralis]|uniref:Uncharacterized protein n=1 Tax=Pyrocoelia pectoralis TaxID=417401 RepID=A0AAN7VBU5_9COLE
MLPHNIYSLVIKFPDKSQLQDSLLKCAFQYADQGLNVWFISPQPITQLPPNLVPPDKEILQLITFLYLKDRADLLTHLNNVHLWHKYPQVIIVNDYEFYCGTGLTLSAFVVASILDATVACSRRHRTKRGYFLLSFTRDCANFDHMFSMYVRHIYKYDGNEAELLQKIKDSVN